MAPAARGVPERARHRETRLPEVLHGGLVTSALTIFKMKKRKNLQAAAFLGEGKMEA